MNEEKFTVNDVIAASNYDKYVKAFANIEKKADGLCYLRYSTKRQYENSPVAQLNDILDYALKECIWIDKKHIFLEDGKSGKTADKRPEFQRMINYASTTKTGCSKLLVHKYDRFARNKDESGMYKVILKRAGIKMIAVAEVLPEDKQMALVVETQYEMNSQLYSMRLSDEVYKGMRVNAKKGKSQTKAIYGYRKVVKEVIRDTERNRDKIIRETVVFEDEAKIVKMIFEKYINGVSELAIAKELNDLGLKTGGGIPWYDNRVRSILDNITYLGYTHWTETGEETIIAKSDIPPLITQEIWDKKEKIKKTRKSVGKRTQVKQEHWLRGKIKCSNCNNTLVINGGSFQCCAYTHGACKESHSIRVNILEKQLLEFFKNLTKDKIINININNLKLQNNDELAIINEKIKQMNIKNERIMQAYENEIYTLEEFKERKAKISDEINTLKNKLTELKTKQNYENIKNGIYEKCDNMYNILSDDKVPIIDKQTLINAIIDKIIFDKKNNTFEVYYKS